MNVVTAGAAGARFLENNQPKLLSYPEVFKQVRPITTEPEGTLVAYPNRDSIPYKSLYNLPNVETFVRGTLRYAPFCQRWHALAEAGVPNTAILLEGSQTYSDWAFLFSWHPQAYRMLITLVLEANLATTALGTDQTSAEVLLNVLQRCWNPATNYKDRALMRHRIVYKQAGIYKEYVGVLDISGNDKTTAMAFLVGLPLAIMVEKQLVRPIIGVHTASSSLVWPNIYDNLHKHNISMNYQVVDL
jgi:hypothetical protein